MTELLQNVVSALSLGSTYALLALGLALVFSVLGFINFAHGELMTVTGYALFALLSAGVQFAVAAPLAVVAGGLAAMVLERVAFRPVRGADAVTLLVTSFAVTLILHVAFQNLISPRPRGVAVPALLDGNVDLFGIMVGRNQLAALLVTVVAVVGLTALLRRTLLGKSIRAAADDFSTARLMGIRANSVIATTFLLSGLLAGIAGLLWVAQRGTVDPLMGVVPVIKAFVATVIGGMGSLAGAVAGGFLLGSVEIMLQAYLPDGAAPFRDVFVFSILIVFLTLRPGGLLGSRAEEARA